MTLEISVQSFVRMAQGHPVRFWGQHFYLCHTVPTYGLFAGLLRVGNELPTLLGYAV